MKDLKTPGVKLKRSRSVTILAWLHFFQSLVLLIFGGSLIIAEGWLEPRALMAAHYLPLALFDSMVSSVVMIILALLGVFIAIALLRLRTWAWLAAMSLQGLGLLAAIYGYLREQPNYIGMVIGIFLVLYLNQKEIQTAFQSKRAANPEVQK